MLNLMRRFATTWVGQDPGRPAARRPGGLRHLQRHARPRQRRRSPRSATRTSPTTRFPARLSAAAEPVRAADRAACRPHEQAHADGHPELGARPARLRRRDQPVLAEKLRHRRRPTRKLGQAWCANDPSFRQHAGHVRPHQSSSRCCSRTATPRPSISTCRPRRRAPPADRARPVRRHAGADRPRSSLLNRYRNDTRTVEYFTLERDQPRRHPDARPTPTSRPI